MAELELVPVKTRILTDKDDIVDVIEEYAKDMNIACYKSNNLKEAMSNVKNIMESGDVVLLSPACASWDQYKCFEDRGNEFKSLVKEITNE